MAQANRENLFPKRSSILKIKIKKWLEIGLKLSSEKHKNANLDSGFEIME